MSSSIYGFPSMPGITTSGVGVEGNDKAEIPDEGGKPAGNLFAAGEIVTCNIPAGDIWRALDHWRGIWAYSRRRSRKTIK